MSKLTFIKLFLYYASFASFDIEISLVGVANGSIGAAENFFKEFWHFS